MNAAPFAVYLKEDNRNYVEPDVSVICDRNKLDERDCHGAPDWAVEILSPSSVKMDCERKVKLYQETGVREYWIVDAKKETVTVYDFEHNKEAKHYPFSARIPAGILDGLYLQFSEMDLL